MPDRLPLPADALPRALLGMRALRRAVIAFWYATIEDGAAARIEAANAASAVNVLDEAVFEATLGDPYRSRRANDRLGRVVTGLELVRNCETHAPVTFDGLLVACRLVGVPVPGAGPVMRAVYAWADYDSLPVEYRDVPSTETSASKRRARGEAQHGYRQAVQGRHVIETLFDAMAFFEGLDPKLVAAAHPAMRWAFGVSELPDTDPALSLPNRYYLSRPLGIDVWEPFLPDIACGHTERRSAQWESADVTIAELVKRARAAPPVAVAREVRSRIVDESGLLLGFSGYSVGSDSYGSGWVERRHQVWQDVRRGYRYFVRAGGTEVDVCNAGHDRVDAPDASGVDLLPRLPVADDDQLGFSTLRMVEEYDDLYLRMRHAE